MDNQTVKHLATIVIDDRLSSLGRFVESMNITVHKIPQFVVLVNENINLCNFCIYCFIFFEKP